MIQYDREWTILGLVDVQQDMHMLPADRLRFIEVSSGTYRVVVLKGNKAFWEQFKELKEINGDDPIIANLPRPDSVVLKDTGAYANAVRVFKTDDMNSTRRLNQKLQVGADEVEIDVAVPKTDDGTNREILVVRVRHANEQAFQNGTGHGDWT